MAETTKAKRKSAKEKMKTEVGDREELVIEDQPATGVAPRANPNVPVELEEEMQTIEPAVVGPPAYGSPDPTTAAGRLVPIVDHPLEAIISEDYGADVTGATAEIGEEHPGEPSGADVSPPDIETDAAGKGEGVGSDYNEMTVEDLKDKARDREISGFSTMNKDELVKALNKSDKE